MNKTCFELRDIILSVMITFEDSIEKKEVEIRGLEDAPAIFVDGDPDMIHQVVYNLVENAVKFVNPQGYIDVRVLNKGTKAVVKIRNSGQGISADEIPLIFDKFYKTDKSRSMDKNGMGLGLYIVRTIIKLHGGDITVSSVEMCIRDSPRSWPKPVTRKARRLLTWARISGWTARKNIRNGTAEPIRTRSSMKRLSLIHI